MKRLLAAIAVAALSLVVVVTASARIVPPRDKGHDDLGKLAQKFFEFDASIPVVNDSHPALDHGDVDCSLGQHGKVWFLETTPDLFGVYERRCSVPHKTDLYLPVFQWFCSADLDDIAIDDCFADALEGLPKVDLTVSVDGEVLDDAALEAFRDTTRKFKLHLVEDSYWEFAFTLELGKSIEFAADAYGVLITDLEPGEHVLVVSSKSTEFGFEGSLTYRITVDKKMKHKP